MTAPSFTIPMPPQRKVSWRQVLVVITHIFFWACFIYLPFVLQQQVSPDYNLTPERREQISHYVFFFSQFISIIIFYANAHVLLPKILKKHGIGVYILVILATLAVSLTVMYFYRHWVIGSTPRNLFTFSNFYLFISVIGISTCFRLLLDYQREHRLKEEEEKVRLQSELSFLRSQISPHFMFNLMNSLASLARKKSDLLEPMIVKMSDLLRYMLYDSDDAKILLNKEATYIKSYVELQQMRFGNKVKVNVDFDITADDVALEPMLLIPFVENAFKHGTGLIKNPFIDVQLKSKDRVLEFSVENHYNDDFAEVKDSSSGIGLANVKRRLELLYPENHQLSIVKGNNKFATHLKINLK